MKKTYSSVSFRRYGQRIRTWSHTLLAVILSIAGFGTANLNAQNCALACSGAQISLDAETCTAEVTVEMLADTSQCLNGQFTVYVITIEGDTIPTSPLVTENEIGMTLIASVYDEISQNSCWAWITVEDKKPPTIECDCDPNIPVEELPEECFVRCVDLDLDLFPGPEVSDNCSDPNEIELVLLDEDVETLCDPDYIKRVTRYYTAFDEYGNQSDTCAQVLYSERIDFDDIVWPDSFTISLGNPFECDEGFTDLDGNGCPDPIPLAEGGAGVPRIDGVPVYPDFMFYCNAQITVEDVPIGPIGCVQKCMRIWTAYEWHCTGEFDTIYVQMIEVVDNDGPELTCPDTLIVSTDFHDCDATIHVPLPEAVDACNDVVQISATYPGGFLEHVTGFQYIDLGVGEHVITFTAYDECYNSSECEWIVIVEDHTPPVPVCDEHTVVSLTNSGPFGLTKVDASVFDDGSYDECGPVTFLARRMNSCIDFDWTTQGAGIDEIPDGFVLDPDRGTVFRPKVPFACCDVGAGPIMIALQVTDASGNMNTCMVEVTVQDKIGPYIECPNDITISCTFDFDLENLDIFGTVETDPENVNEICIYDPEHPDANAEGFTCWGDDGLAWDNCGVEVTTDYQTFLDACGTGYIIRNFYATDPGDRIATCQQRIDIINFDPFYINPENPNDPTDDVIWPQSPYEAFGCGNDVDPEVTGFPEFFEDECDLIGYTYEDQIFPFVQGACFKILRKWEVIDWCQYETGSPGSNGIISGYWTFTQVIKVMNTEAPEFLTTQPDISECNEFNCDGLFIELFQEAEDDCTPDEELVWEVHYDLDNDLVIDDSDSGNGNTIDASRVFPIGSHRVIYSFEDKCGNKTVKEQFVEVLACKPPTPICINGLSADLMPVDTDNDGEPDWGMITIWASDFDKGSYHACGYDVVVSFSPDTTEKSRVFDCDDLGPEPVLVQLWVTDVVLGEQAYCETYIIIQDNMEVCPEDPGGTGIISGVISTEFTATVKNVEVNLNGSSLYPVVTSGNGAYAFPSMPYGGSYEVAPVKNDDWKNGVSTLDLVKMQKHLLGIEELNSPYKYIAADANRSGSISAVDILEIRKLILGIYEELPNNTSWRFVDQAYTFTDPSNPFADAFPESYTINPFNTDMENVNFIGIKTGDVNETVQANAQGIEVRSGGETFYFSAQNAEFNGGEVVDLAITAEDFGKLLGYQYTMEFDAGKLVFEQIIPGELDINSEYFGTNYASNGVITTSWSSPVAKTVDPGAVLFTLRFKALNHGMLSDAISIGSAITSAEAYDATDKIYDVALRFDEGVAGTHDYALFQNTPNPYSEATVIGYNMAEAGKATITVFDLQGKVLYQTDQDAVAGYNTVTIHSDAIQGTGVMYYQLESNGFTATRKMIKM